MANKGIKIDGIVDLDKALGLTQKEQRNLNRNTIQAIAKRISDKAKQNLRNNATVDTGRLAGGVVAKRRRPKNPNRPFSDVRILSGKNVPKADDAWYWHFVEYGTEKQRARPFIRPAVDEIHDDIIRIYRSAFGAKLEAMLRRKAKKQRRG